MTEVKAALLPSYGGRTTERYPPTLMTGDSGCVVGGIAIIVMIRLSS